ncbi:MAG: 50S ribosomal protein L4 [Mycoplasmataceae bacterium]|jgi:large subunit ribosomal protein L4|nr:50S ribosomal protein L4 [Mycoplasmataceae bacterium]
MSKIKKIDLTGKSIGEVESHKNFVVEKPHSQAMFEAVIAENAGRRQGTHSTLTKGEVRGGGKKPYAQKHTGNARQGSIRNPHYVGGGVVFGPKPTRNYKVGVNKKVSKLAFASAVSVKLKNEAIFILEDSASSKKPSTKAISTMLKTLKLLNKKILFVFNSEKAEALIKSAQNINRTVVKKPNQVSTQDIMHANFVIVQESALDTLAKVVA